MRLVSIIVPMYNAERFIERCALSLCQQTYQSLELVFVDDCSSDNTIEQLRQVLEKFPQRRVASKVISLDCNQGVAHARQVGLDNVSGDFVTQIDADDYISVDYVSNMMEAIERGNADIAVCDFVYIYDTMQSTVHVNAPDEVGECLARIMTGEMHSGFMNKLIRRTLYTDNNLTMVPGLNIMEDKVMMLKLFTFAQHVVYVPKPMYFYDKTNVNSATAQEKVKHLPYIAMAWSEVKKFCNSREKLSKRMSEAVEFYRIGILGTMLFCADLSDMGYESSLIARPKLSMIHRQPVIPANYKAILCCYALHLDFLVGCLRWLKRRLA